MKFMPLSEAIRIPIKIHYRVKYYVEKNCHIFTNGKKVEIGLWAGAYHQNVGDTYIELTEGSCLEFKGKATISKGTSIVARNRSTISFGNNFFCNANCLISSRTGITFGENSLLGWNISVLDNDGHSLFENSIEENQPKPITIDNHCWIGAHATILKGVHLTSNTIIPYGSIINKSNTVTNSVFGGMPNHILKENISWRN